MENELIHNAVYCMKCDYCNLEFIIAKKPDDVENIKDIAQSTYGWCGQCVDGHS